MPIRQLSQRGFTLIELMVVITIIAVLATVGAVMYSTTQKTARVSKRIQDLRAMQTAIETYKATKGSYPVTSGWRSECPSWGGKANNDVVPTATSFIPQFMSTFPVDPAMDKTNNQNCYLYYSDGNDYKIMDYQVYDMSTQDIFNQIQYVDLRYNKSTLAPAGFPSTFCAGAAGNNDNRALSVYSGGGVCF